MHRDTKHSPEQRESFSDQMMMHSLTEKISDFSPQAVRFFFGPDIIKVVCLKIGTLRYEKVFFDGELEVMAMMVLAPRPVQHGYIYIRGRQV